MAIRFRVPGILAQKLNEQKVSLPAVLRHAGLPMAFFDQEKISVTTEELFALWRAIAAVSSDPAVGLKIGAEQRANVTTRPQSQDFIANRFATRSSGWRATSSRCRKAFEPQLAHFAAAPGNFGCDVPAPSRRSSPRTGPPLPVPFLSGAERNSLPARL